MSEYISKETDSNTSKYDNFLLLGDFNLDPTAKATKTFCQVEKFKKLLEKSTCYKNHTNPSCAYLIIKNDPKSFKNSFTFETRLPNYHKKTVTVLKSSLAKQKPRVINYPNYKFFNNTLFRDQVLDKLRKSNFQTSDKDLKNFKETCLSVVNTITPLKSRFILANQVPFINEKI